jgi:hypothetical protein
MNVLTDIIGALVLIGLIWFGMRYFTEHVKFVETVEKKEDKNE